MPNLTNSKQAQAPLSKRLYWAVVGAFSIPTCSFVGLAVLLLGYIAWVSASSMLMQPSNSDIWQHAASISALINDLGDPANPFVVSEEGSRHFHPLWVGWAAVAQYFDLSVWDVLGLAGFLSMAVLAAGIFLFTRAYHPSPWAPLVLLLVMMLGWVLPIRHTGLHSIGTLFYAAPYPATYMIGFGFILWAVTIRALENAQYALLLVLLSAFMFTTHQLGAVISLIGVGCFILCWPNGTIRTRLIASLAIIFGLGISTFWPYHNPFVLALQPGNSTWDGGPNFYSFVFLTAAFVPSVFGVLGLRDRRSRPLALALLLYFLLFLLGLGGIQIASRFMMPITLVLHIGLAFYLATILDYPNMQLASMKMIIKAVSVTTVLLHVIFLNHFGVFDAHRRIDGASIYEAAQTLTHNIPDSEQVAAHSLAAWPIVGVGQKVLSIPWPEPAIHDLHERQAASNLLFDDGISREERIENARKLGVRTLIADRRFLPMSTVALLRSQSVSSEAAGPLMRFDLFDLGSSVSVD